MTRRTLRPSSRRTLVFVAVLLGIVAWVIWELGLFLRHRVAVAVISGLVLMLTALGWLSQ